MTHTSLIVRVRVWVTLLAVTNISLKTSTYKKARPNSSGYMPYVVGSTHKVRKAYAAHGYWVVIFVSSIVSIVRVRVWVTLLALVVNT